MATRRQPPAQLPRRSGVTSWDAPSTESLLAPYFGAEGAGPSDYASAKSDLEDEQSDSYHSFYQDDLKNLPDGPSLPSSPSFFAPPPSPPLSLSESSSESTTFQLSSPFPRNQAYHQPPSTRTRQLAVSNKENTSRASSPATTVGSHIRIQSKPSRSIGFPHTTSLLVTSDSLADVRGKGTKLFPGKGKQRQDVLAREDDDDEGGRRSSSDVDLDLSFDFHSKSPTPSVKSSSFGSHEGGNQLEACRVTGRVGRSEWVGIPISPAFSHRSSSSTIDLERERYQINGTTTTHTVPASELVRSQSGQLLGTRKRVRSAIELRAAFLAAEPEQDIANHSLSISMDSEGLVEDVAGFQARTKEIRMADSARAEWVRKTNGVAPLRLGEFQPPVISPSLSRFPELGSGFAFNATDPLAVPLPESPISPSTPDYHRGRNKVLMLPLKITEQTAQIPAGLPSPAWSLASFFRRGSVQDEGGEPDSPGSPQPSWVSEAKRGVLGYLSRRPPESSSSDTSGQPSPDFDSPLSLGGSSTTTPNQSPKFPDQLSSTAVQQIRRKFSKPTSLSGLGLDMGNTSGSVFAPLAGRIPLSQRRNHANIPSLSISPPPASENDRFDLANDPTATSLAKRISRQLTGGDARVSSPTHDRDPLLPTASPRSPNPGLRSPRSTSDSPSRTRAHLQTSATAPRFSFTPEPLSLVGSQNLRPTNQELVGLIKGDAVEVGHRRNISVASFKEFMTTSGSAVDEIAPAKLLFLLGFFFGPWCWILGGWWLRKFDGELRSTHGTRCQESGCACGRVVQWYSIAAMGRHGTIGIPNLPAEDSWVRMNRVASVSSGSVVFALVVVALWAAATP
ncbi:hypothetical protein P7C70_g5185, partial [Phenoliferia sp. Uapishka_3]